MKTMVIAVSCLLGCANLSFAAGPEGGVSADTAIECSTLSGGICAGDIVLTDGGKVGLVKMLFANGMASVRVGADMLTLKTAQLAKSVEQLDGFAVGNTVLTNDGKIGQVKRLFIPGVAHIIIEPEVRTYKTEQIFKSVKQYENLSADNIVLTEDVKVGVVKQLFANGMARVFVQGDMVICPAQQLAKSVERLGNFAIGNCVYAADGKIGHIKRLFANGMAFVAVGPNVLPYPVGQLSGAVACER